MLNQTKEIQRFLRDTVGALMYFCCGSRPDIAFANFHIYLDFWTSMHTSEHWNVVKCIMLYLKGTTDLAIKFSQKSEEGRKLMSLQ